jgi:hypothetical protein
MFEVAYATNISIWASNLITTFSHSNLVCISFSSSQPSVKDLLFLFCWISKDLLFI